MTRLVMFLKTAIIYFIGNILTRVIGIFLLPLYTSKLLPSEFGSYDLVTVILSFGVPIIFCQIWDGMFRFAFDKNQNDEKYQVISTSTLVFLIGIIIYSIGFIFCINMINFEYKIHIFFYGLVFAIQYQYSFIARIFLENKLFVMSGLISSIVNASFNILLIKYFNYGIESLYISFILGGLIQVCIIESKLKPLKKIKFKNVDKNLLIKMVKFSIPLCVATISYWLLSGYTKIVISTKLGVYENGLYAVAGKFSIIISLFVSVFQYAWNEMAYMMSNDQNRVEKYKISIKYLIKIVVIGSASSILFIKVIFPIIIDKSYADAIQIIPVALIGVSFNSLAGFLGTIFMTEKKTKYILWTTVYSAICNIILVNLLTDKFGIQGAVGGLGISFMLLAILRLILIIKIFNIKIRIPYICYTSFLTMYTYIFYKVNNTWTLLFWIVISIIILLYNIKDIIIKLINKKKRLDIGNL